MDRSLLDWLTNLLLRILGLLSLHAWGRFLCLCFLKKMYPSRHFAPFQPRLWNELYTLAAIAVSSILLWWAVPRQLGDVKDGDAIRSYEYFAIYAIYRVVEIMRTSSAIIFIDRQRRFAPSGIPLVGSYYTLIGNLNSWLMLTVLQFLDLISCFAILCLATGDCWDKKINTPLDAFYTTAVTMLTVGYGDHHPNDDVSKVLVVVELLCFIAYGLLLIPFTAASFKTMETYRGILKQGKGWPGEQLMFDPESLK
jgi:hypothetical protein